MSEPRSVSGLTRLERRWLGRRICAWCGRPLDQDPCGAIWEACAQADRDQRRGNALATYRPRTTPPASDRTQEGREDA